MAYLDKRGDDRKDWLRWAIELLRRGILAGETITVHGPHGPDAPFMWGETEGEIDGSGFGRTLRFRTVSGIRGIYDVRGVTVRDEEGEKYPVLPVSELTPKARRWLAKARRVSNSLIEAAKAEAREVRALWDGAR